MAQTLEPARILRRREVEARVGLRRSALYRQIKIGTFPKPIRLSGNVSGGAAVGWLAAEVSAWLAQRVAERDAEAQRGAA